MKGAKERGERERERKSFHLRQQIFLLLIREFVRICLENILFIF